MELLEISDATYKTYVSVGLLRPITAPRGTRHTFTLASIIKQFQLQ
jgi:hypothetical protein